MPESLPPNARAVAARKVAAWLADNGDPFRANAVRSVCRSLDSARATLATLHRDNMALRAEIAALKGERP